MVLNISQKNIKTKPMDSKNKCEHCEEPLKAGREVWLELSNTDGLYYAQIPAGHESQGAFPFGSQCAKNIIKTQNAPA